MNAGARSVGVRLSGWPVTINGAVHAPAAQAGHRRRRCPAVAHEDEDGRNRYAACQLAGIEPTFTTYDGDDPDGYALAANGQRRDLTKSNARLSLPAPNF